VSLAALAEENPISIDDIDLPIRHSRHDDAGLINTRLMSPNWASAAELNSISLPILKFCQFRMAWKYDDCPGCVPRSLLPLLRRAIVGALGPKTPNQRPVERVCVWLIS